MNAQTEASIRFELLLLEEEIRMDRVLYEPDNAAAIRRCELLRDRLNSRFAELGDGGHLEQHTNDGGDDNTTFFQNNLPMNDKVTALCRHLKDKRAKFPSEVDCARAFCRKKKLDTKKALNLLRQARRFPHLWKQ